MNFGIASALTVNIGITPQGGRPALAGFDLMASITIIQPLRSSSQLLVAFGTRSPFLFSEYLPTEPFASTRGLFTTPPNKLPTLDVLPRSSL
jgi:hypothetical protein